MTMKNKSLFTLVSIILLITVVAVLKTYKKYNLKSARQQNVEVVDIHKNIIKNQKELEQKRAIARRDSIMKSRQDSLRSKLSALRKNIEKIESERGIK